MRSLILKRTFKANLEVHLFLCYKLMFASEQQLLAALDVIIREETPQARNQHLCALLDIDWHAQVPCHVQEAVRSLY